MSLHTCPPPIDALQDWLDDYGTTNGQYGHLLLEQTGENDEKVIEALRHYLESAFLDARTYFHAEVGIDLHPDAQDEGGHAQYPYCLPSSARRGIFGEVLAGLVTESYRLVGDYDWHVPIFLFRYHHDVAAYMFALARDPARQRQVWGRFGNDFIAIAFDGNGSIDRFLAGEAKWRTTLSQAAVDRALHGDSVQDSGNPQERVHNGKGVWYEVNRDIAVPQGVRQLQRLLKEHDSDGYAEAIVSMDRVLCVKDSDPPPRTDLILLAGNSPARRKEGTTLIDSQEIPPEYTAGNDLQIVEAYFRGGNALIDALYESLWIEETADADG